MQFIELDLEYTTERTSSVRTPEQDMFFAVVRQALEDLRTSEWNTNARRKDAREWLLYDSKDFFVICNLADVDAEQIRHIANRYIAHLDKGGAPRRIILADVE